MPERKIEFDISKFSKIKEDGQKFWDGNLQRPLIQAYLSGKGAQRQLSLKTESEILSFFDEKLSSEGFVDIWGYKLSDLVFMGDGFPFIRPLLGSSAMAVYNDCNYVVDANTIWFEPSRSLNLKDVQLRYNFDNIWFKRTLEIYATACKRWNGSVQPVITNIGGVFDILAMIIPSEQIVYAMYDQPEEIKRLTWQIHNIWWQYYDELSKAILPYSIGYMDFWLPIPCQKPSFILQCDFCCLLSKKLFDEFVKPELEQSCRRLGGAMYHLDGPGAIRHLDSLLSIDNLKVIQWVPGDGQKDVTEWPELYKKVRDAGKQLFITGEGNCENFDKIVEILGSSEGLCYIASGDVREHAKFEEWLKGYGVF
ncbi:MAG: hypothetical protein A2Y12_04755 [Planctomycetes bacterium GWF2_42_9]|nr:MAG: hypothetical protein A2Y12_04755 [Planctomycetes bacterium GWF2_42_9]